jgi:hypothetical protein
LTANAGDLPLTIYPTNETRPFTSSIARNIAAREVASGEFVLMNDVDYIIPQALIDYCMDFTGDKIQFTRELGVLDENGRFTQDMDVLLGYGLQPERAAQTGVHIRPHPNVYLMRRALFLELGGYREDYVLNRPYPQGEDRLWKKAWHRCEQAGRARVHHERPVIYMFPVGQFCGDVDYNPFGLFHNLSRKTNSNWLWKKQRSRGL